jgi:hypothetical protein
LRDNFSHEEDYEPPKSEAKVALNCGILAYREVSEGSSAAAPIHDRRKKNYVDTGESILKFLGGTGRNRFWD